MGRDNMKEDETLVICLSGRANKDLQIVADTLLLLGL
jgi:tryptophan synthase beta subunit